MSPSPRPRYGHLRADRAGEEIRCKHDSRALKKGPACVHRVAPVAEVTGLFDALGGQVEGPVSDHAIELHFVTRNGASEDCLEIIFLNSEADFIAVYFSQGDGRLALIAGGTAGNFAFVHLKDESNVAIPVPALYRRLPFPGDICAKCRQRGK